MPKAPPINWKELTRIALEARGVSYAPYSKFHVGAALLTEVGVRMGANVENATYGLCICAERVAVVKAVTAGDKQLQALVVATQSTPASPPCGLCLQTLSEFAQDIPILLVSTKGGSRRTSLRKLFPGAFSGRLLKS